MIYTCTIMCTFGLHSIFTHTHAHTQALRELKKTKPPAAVEIQDPPRTKFGAQKRAVALVWSSANVKRRTLHIKIPDPILIDDVRWFRIKNADIP